MDQNEKYKKIMKCLDYWLMAHEKGNYVADYLKHCHYKKIGIYGYGVLGRHLVYELMEGKFKIQWVMDKFSTGDEKYEHIIRPDDRESQKDVDIAIITAVTVVEEIEMFLSGFVTGQIISVEELIENMWRWSS